MTETLIVGRVLTFDPSLPSAQAVLVRDDRIVAAGKAADLHSELGSGARVIDEGGWVLPAFHDAHLHLLKYARSGSKLDLRGVSSLRRLQSLLRERSASLPPGAWLRGWRYDDKRLADGRHPTRQELDSAVPDRPVRLEHRGLHLDLLNTPALAALGLLDAPAPGLELDTEGIPTGRLYDGGELLRARQPRSSAQEISVDVGAASDRLLSWGVTSVQDASATNDLYHWELLHALTESGDLRVRTAMLPGAEHWPAVHSSPHTHRRLTLGPVKIMLREGFSDPGEVLRQVNDARSAGLAVAFHAVTDAELAIALHVLHEAAPGSAAAPDRIEHGATIPDDWLADLRELRVTVVGQPGLILDRGDHYLADHAAEQHGWLHRARTLVDAGIPYAVGSDAPVLAPSPIPAFRSLLERRTRSGEVLGEKDRLSVGAALASLTRGPALAIGREHLGILRPGAIADIVVMGENFVLGPSDEDKTAEITMTDGQIVWEKATSQTHQFA